MLYALLLLLFIYNSVVFITTALEHDGKAQHGGGVVGGRYEIIWNRWNMVKQWNLYISRCKEWSGICSMQAGWSGLPAWLHPLTLSTTATYFITLLVPSTHGTCFQSVSICFDMFRYVLHVLLVFTVSFITFMQRFLIKFAVRPPGELQADLVWSAF